MEHLAGPPGGRLARFVAYGVAGALVAGLSAACNAGKTEDPAPRADPAPSASEPATTLDPRPASSRVRVTRVSGELAARDREVLADNVGAVVRRYFDDAFLGGDHPRTDYDRAFATFTPGARRRAQADRSLLTNAVLGPTTDQVVVRRQTAYLSVLAPYRVAAGVTARVELRYVAVRDDRRDKLVSVTGRLLLTRAESGGWAIFGYDLNRSVRPVREVS